MWYIIDDMGNRNNDTNTKGETMNDHEKWIGTHIKNLPNDADWTGAWPIVDATGTITGIGYAGSDLSGYDLADWVDGRAVVRECASDCLVARID
jgi:hypothetical protein